MKIYFVSARAPSVESIPYSASTSANTTLSTKSGSNKHNPHKRSKSAVGNRRHDKSPSRTPNKHYSDGHQFGLDNLTDFFNTFVNFGEDHKHSTSAKPKFEVVRQNVAPPGFEPPPYEPPAFTTPESIPIPTFSHNNSSSGDNCSVSSSGTLYKSAIYLGSESNQPTPTQDRKEFATPMPWQFVPGRNFDSKSSSNQSVISDQALINGNSANLRNVADNIRRSLELSRELNQLSSKDPGRNSALELQRNSLVSLDSDISVGEKKKRKPLSFLNSSFLSLQFDLSKNSRKSDLKGRQFSTTSLQNDNIRSQTVSNVLLSSVQNSRISLSPVSSGVYDQPQISSIRNSKVSLTSDQKYPSIRDLFELQESANELRASQTTLASNSDTLNIGSQQSLRSRSSVKRSSNRTDRSKEASSKRSLLETETNEKYPLFKEVHPKIVPTGTSVQSLHCLNPREIQRASKNAGNHSQPNHILHRNSRSTAALILPNKFDPFSGSRSPKRIALSPARGENESYIFSTGFRDLSSEPVSRNQSMFRSDFNIGNESVPRTGALRVDTSRNPTRESGYYSSLSPLAPNEFPDREHDVTGGMRANSRTSELNRSREPIELSNSLRSVDHEFRYIDDPYETPLMGHKTIMANNSLQVGQPSKENDFMSSFSPFTDSGNFEEESFDQNLVPMIDDEQPVNLMECISISNDSNLLQVSDLSPTTATENIPFIDNEGTETSKSATVEPLMFGNPYAQEKSMQVATSNFQPMNELSDNDSLRTVIDIYRDHEQIDTNSKILVPKTDDSLMVQKLDDESQREKSETSLELDMSGSDLRSETKSINSRSEGSTASLSEKQPSSEPAPWHSFSKSCSITLSCVPGMNYLQALDTPTLAFLAYYSFLPVLHDTCVSLTLAPKKFK